MTNIFALLKNLGKIQGEMKQLQEELGHQRVTGFSGGEMVKATFNGRFELLDLYIEPGLARKQGEDVVQQLVVAAVNDGLVKLQRLIRDRFTEATGGLELPGGGMPGMFG